MKLEYDIPQKGFTQVPNALLSCSLSASNKLTWIQIASACRDGKADVAGGMSEIAAAHGIPYSAFIKAVRRLKEAGGLEGDRTACRLVIPSDDHEPEPESTIIDELEDQPKRKPSGVSQKESMLAIRGAWNKNKPEAWMQMDGRMHPSLFIAIETHAKRLGIERPDYPGFVSAVLQGAAADPWWSAKTMKPSNLFGWGTEIKDCKFQNVEKLYRSNNKAKPRLDLSDDNTWLEWYDGYKGIKTIIRKTAADYWEALDRVDEETDPTAAYLWFAEGKSRPHHWTGRNDQSTRKFRYLPE